MSVAHDIPNEVSFFFSEHDYQRAPDTMSEDNFQYLSKSVLSELAGKTYSEWRYAREAIYKAVYKHHRHNFSLADKQQQKGRSWFATQHGYLGENRRVEIHHVRHCQWGMENYDNLGNLVILYPLTHHIVHILDSV